MKKILLCLMLTVSFISYSWEYEKDFRYDLDKNIQVLGQVEEGNQNNLFISLVDDDIMSINLTGYYELGAIFNVNVYVDNNKIETLKFKAINTQVMQALLSKKLATKMKNGKELIMGFAHSQGSSTYKFNLMGFTKGYNKITGKKFIY